MLVGCFFPEQTEARARASLEELQLLTDTAGGKVCAVIEQKRSAPDSATYIGKGKVQEISALIEQLAIETVIFNAMLTPGQQSRLAELLPVKVIDRTQLILDIFALRARSREGKLQVERAQLQYMLPRLSGSHAALSRLGGGIGTRGPGETKLETDRRHVRGRMRDIDRQLAALVRHRANYRERRERLKQCQIALVGYTNAGKSALFNRLTDAHALEEDRLFATLDPLTRRFRLTCGFSCLLSDTVGFIRELPTELVAAFRSTLEEVCEAQLIIHVIDASDPDLIAHEETVRALLATLGADQIPVLTVYNKKELLRVPFITPAGALLISAFDPMDQEVFAKAVERCLKATMLPYHYQVPAKAGTFLTKLQAETIVESWKFDSDRENYDVSGFVFPDHALSKRLIGQDVEV